MAGLRGRAARRPTVNEMTAMLFPHSELELATEPNASRPSSLATVAGSGQDQMTLKLGKTAKHG